MVNRHDLEIAIEHVNNTETVYEGFLTARISPYPHILKTGLIKKALGIILEKDGQ